jgi:hypothetical protein
MYLENSVANSRKENVGNHHRISSETFDTFFNVVSVEAHSLSLFLTRLT